MVIRFMLSTQRKTSPIRFTLLLVCLTILAGFSACRSLPQSQGVNQLLKAEMLLPEKTEEPSATLGLVNPSPSTTPPSFQATPEGTEIPTEKSADLITIRVVFDNYPYQDGLDTGWGFSAFVTYKDQNVLFDTGANGSILLKNMNALHINASEIQNVVLSHEHGDHTAGLQQVLSAGANPKIYLPPSFSSSFKNQFNYQVEVIEVTPGLPIAERISTSGEIPGSPPEQALVIDTTRGLIVITGCAHPGVEKMVLAAKRYFKEDVYLVMGGSHLGSASTEEVKQIIKEFKRIGVVQVAPCHCTGDRAIRQFKDAFGDNFIRLGVGAVIEIET